MSKFLDANTFSVLLASVMKEKKLSHIEGILEICQQRSLEVESVPKLLDPKLRKRIYNEGVNLFLLKSPKRVNRVI